MRGLILSGSQLEWVGVRLMPYSLTKAMRVLVTFFCLISLLSAQEVKLPPKERFHLFLLMGQSNMAGRGVVEEQDKTPHPRVLMLNKEREKMPCIQC